MPVGGTATTFVIQELSAQTGAPGTHALLLAGRALPFRPYELEGEMRATSTFYPGSTVGTLQMLGAKENPSSIHGRWSDVFIKPTTDEGETVIPDGIAQLDGTQATDVMALAKFTDMIRRRGQLISVSWDEQARKGYLRKFRQKWLTRQDLEWEIDFEFISQDENPTPVAFPTSPNQSDLLSNLQSQLGSVLDAVQAPFQVLFAIGDQINTYTAALQDAVNSIQNASVNLSFAATAPADAARRSLAAAQAVIDNTNNIISTVQSVPSLALINSDDIASLGEGDALAASKWSRGVVRSAQVMKATASEQSDQFRILAEQQDVIAVFTARDAMDLRRVSVTYYGTQDNWQQIMQFNGLSSSLLVAGQLILIPKLTAQEV